MKKTLMLCSALCLLAIPLGAAQVHAGTYGYNVTIYDKAGQTDGSRGVGVGYEDQETEPNMLLNQSWDLEAFEVSMTKQLAVIGGFDFATGKADGYTEPIGAVFIKMGRFGPPYGNGNVAGYNNEVVSNSNFGYGYAITFDFTHNQYTVYQAGTAATVKLHGPDGQAYGDVSNPWTIADGWNAVNGYAGLAFNYQTGLPDFDNLQGGSHNVISGISLGFLGDDPIWLHLTYECGNDNLMGFDPDPGGSNVPIPGSLLLLGTGLAGLSLTGFRRRKQVG